LGKRKRFVEKDKFRNISKREMSKRESRESERRRKKMDGELKVSMFQNVTRITRVVLVITAVLDIIPGLIHCFKNDGGAGSIAGITLSWPNAATIHVGSTTWNAADYHKETVLVLFYALGQTQAKHGIVVLLAALGLKQSMELCTFVLVLTLFQVISVIISVTGYRNIHTIAPDAPGQYKSYLILLLFSIAAMAQMIWYRNRGKQEIHPTKR